MEGRRVESYLVQARRQECDFKSADRQLTREFTLALLLGGVGTGWETTNTDDISAAKVHMLLLEGRSLIIGEISLGKDLEPSALASKVVEDELATGGTLDIDATSQLDRLALVALTVLEVGEVLGEVADIIIDIELITLVR
jgi:hypothetical protein